MTCFLSLSSLNSVLAEPPTFLRTTAQPLQQAFYLHTKGAEKGTEVLVGVGPQFIMAFASET